MAVFSLQLMGEFAATLDGRPVDNFRTRLAQALLIYLAAQPERHRRELVMDVFWPDLPPASAQQNLRQNLYLLRQTVADITLPDGREVPVILADRDTLQLNPEAGVRVDACRLSQIFDRLQPTPAELEEAVALYRGDFLADFTLPYSDSFERWTVDRREAYRRGILDALRQLAGLALDQGDTALAESLTRQQLAIDPLEEAANRRLMDILARSGRRVAALTHFEAYARLIQQELDLSPGAETLTLVDRIRKGDLPAERDERRPVRGYELMEELGRSRHAAVYRARQVAVDRDVAVKVIAARFADNVEFIRRFEAEAQIIARLEHPHIVPLYDYWREPGGAYLVMRYLRGGSLRDLTAGGPLAADRVAALLDEVASALAEAHHNGIVHCDVTTGNILLDAAGTAYLSDFGIAQLLQAELPPQTSDLFIGTPSYVAPEQVLNQPLTPLSDQYSLGIVVYELLTGQTPFAGDSLADLFARQLHDPLPAVHPRRPAVPAAVDEVLARATAKDPADRFPDVTAFAQAFRAATREAPLDAVLISPDMPQRNPYRGLLPFRESDAAFFFGREAMVEQLLDRLEQPGPHRRFLALVGPSGSGKSSLVRAGLVPALRRDAIAGSGNWFMMEMTAVAQPFDELEAALLRVAVRPPADLGERLRRDAGGLAEVVREVLPAGMGGELLLIIDQFEALFTDNGDLGAVYLFLDSLSTAALSDACPLRVLITLRADFYDRPLLHAGFSELLRDRTEVVVPLSAEELTHAIVRPAGLAGVEVEPALVAALVAEVKEQPAALPLLQYTLSELFDHREGNRLTPAVYEELGGIQGALIQRAEGVYGGLAPSEQDAARALFSRLAAFTGERDVTRRRAALAELTALRLGRPVESGEPATDEPQPAVDMGEVIDSFGRARLLSFGRDPLTRAPTVEIAHEALLTAWPRLFAWLEVDRAAIRLERLLTQATDEWLAAGENAGYLLRGARLDQLAPLPDGHLPLTADERRFLAESLRARRERAAAEEARRHRELTTAQSLAESETRRADEQALAARRLRGLVALLSAVALVAAVAALLAFRFGRTADANADLAATRAVEAQTSADLAATREVEALLGAQLATSRELSAAAANSLDVDPELSILLASQALAHADTKEANEALHQAIQASRTLLAFPTGATGYDGPPLAYDPHSGRVATAGNDAVTIWDPLSGEAVAELPLVAPARGHLQLAFNAAGDAIALVSAGDDLNTVVVSSWALPGGEPQPVAELPIALPEVAAVALSPDWRLVAAGRRDGAVEVWDVAAQEPVLRQAAGDSAPVAIEFSGSGGLLATGEANGLVQVWDVAGSLEQGEPVLMTTIDAQGSTAGSGNLTLLSFLDEDTLALGFLGGIDLWDLSDPERPPIRPQGPVLLTHEFAALPELDRFGTAGQDGTIQLWAISDGRHLLSLAQHAAPVDSLALSPDGRRAYTLDRTGQLRVWDAQLAALGEAATLPVDAAVFDVELSPDGRHMALGNAGGPASTWDLATGERLRVFPGGGAVYRVAYSSDGRRLATVGSDNLVRVWDAASGAELLVMAGHGPGVAANLFPGTLDVAFSPDGERLASVGADGLLILWDPATGEELMRLAEHGDSILSVAWSPDGRTIATAGDDGDTAVILWDAATGEVRHRLEGHAVRAWAVAFSPDSTRLISGGARGIIKAWDVDSGANLYTVVDEADVVGTVAFAPDGETFISTGEVPLRVRRASDGEELLTLSPPLIWSAAYSADGRLVYGGDVTGAVRVFALAPEEVEALALSRLTRWWTADECRRYLHSDSCPPRPDAWASEG